MNVELKALRLIGAVLLRLSVAVLSTLLLACAHSAVDKPLQQWTPEIQQKSVEKFEGKGVRAEDITVMMGFSGGGARAAALAYGVLKELDKIMLGESFDSHSLLDEVDAISSVSGGSFAAAYYGLHGKKMFTDFEQRFLRKDIEAVLLAKMFNPVNWVKLMSGEYGRSDLAAEYYDKQIFDGATMSDLSAADTPLVIINATDLATGDRFPFTYNTFDLICADFSSYSLSRAVSASTALPIIFSPITLESYAGSCGYQTPDWQLTALKDKEMTPRKIAALRFEDYTDKKKRPWLHLVDGGISDNLGLRSFYQTLNLLSVGSTAEELKKQHADHVIIISVNAHAKQKSGWMLERYAPSMFEMLESMSADQIARYSADTIQLVKYSFDEWLEGGIASGRQLTFHFVEVSFNQVNNDKDRDFFNDIGTNYDLSDEQVDRLIAIGGKILRESKELHHFLTVIGAEQTDGRPAVKVSE